MTDEPRVTLRRIAEEAGVSPMTVSNAFNRPDQLSRASRERILAIAERLGYAGPDPLARGLRRGRAGAIGLVSDTRLSYAFDDPAASAVITGVCAATEEEGLGLLLVTRGGAGPLSRAVVDGVVVYSVADDDPLLAQALRRRLPAVVIDQPGGTPLPRVGIDDERAAHAAAAHLTALGHRRLAVVSFAFDPAGPTGAARLSDGARARHAVTRDRLAGYAAALAEAGIDPRGAPLRECAGSDRAAGRDAAAALLGFGGPDRPTVVPGEEPRGRAQDRPTAILATSDVLALGVLDAAAAAGLRVPEDLSVAGFDDVPAAATAGLTSVRQDHRAKGRLAGELLLAALRGEPAAAPPAPLPHALVERASTAAPPARP